MDGMSMCDWGSHESIEVTIPNDLSYTGKERKAVKKIDKCIAPIIRALELGGIKMRSSCCGHEKHDGKIHLQDGRILIIKGKASKQYWETLE